MKFILTYDGELGSNKGPASKWKIREQFHPQLDALWQNNPSLKSALINRHIPKTGMFIPGTRNPADPESRRTIARGATPVDDIDLCEPIEMCGRKFIPLVRDSYKLTCSLKINFLRHDPPGKIYQGDLDNRIKTLFDALTIPKHPEQMQKLPTDIPDPTYCLLEDDSLITGFDIDTQQLWALPTNASRNYVRLTITVDIRLTESLLYNHHFLGG